ncbi:MAG: hypothetical protein ABIL25_05985 [candidate division WOR-3 bacterium]
MARLIVDPDKKHLIERACQRRRLSKEQADKVIQKLVQTVSEQAPDDWRFTTSPVAKFIIAYEPGGPDCRFIGRTYRDHNGRGSALVQRLKAETVSELELQVARDEYRSLLEDPECDIFHELKTCYEPKQDLSDEKQFFEGMKLLVPHVVPMQAKQVAQRPNAIVDKGELWVRQGEFANVADEVSGNRWDRLLFVRLTKNGLDPSRQRVYKIDCQGTLRLEQEQEYEDVVPVPRLRPAGALRSQGYWMVPTYVDAVFIDLTYAHGNWAGDGEEYRLDAGGMLLLARLEALFRPFRPKKPYESARH